MKFFADFNIHSKYSRGTHPDMEMPTLAKWAKLKGVALLGTGDFTHPQWLVELKKFLKPASGRGVYEYNDIRFLLTTEVVCVYTRGGRTYKINHLLFAPNFSTADRLIDALEHRANLETEARPSVNLSPEDLVKTALEVSPECLVVPAHAWGLHHSLFSPQFGFDLLDEAYGKFREHIKVIETGHCCDPAMARRWSQVDGCALISNSDAHHPAHIGREANILDCPVDYKEILSALTRNDRSRFLGTVEMFPAEDKYNLSGHRACQAKSADGAAAAPCPACGKPFAPGVADRVAALADRPAAEAESRAGTFHRLISLLDIVADALGFQPDADSVQKQYMQIVTEAGPELDILLLWSEDKLREKLPPRVAEGILSVRAGRVEQEPGYDGVPGRVRAIPAAGPGQLKLFR